MNTRMFTALVFVLLLGGATVVHAAGDPVRGEQLHRDCEGCHGTGLYVPPKAKVKTLAALKKETERWNDRMNPKFSKQEIEDLVAYMNRDFYKFSQ
ncbi:MAG: cytochrome c [Betaproteobacteria bacterium]|nr:cytochrome c [Betaproteobacteria bacterium]MDH4294355.1 cytochrome c [Betaproteobacteria bacterium]MDH5342047.1 cytochrome c [Betaproteobacteria bacterium]